MALAPLTLLLAHLAAASPAPALARLALGAADGGDPDAGLVDAGPDVDAGVDAGAVVDAGAEVDAGADAGIEPGVDAGSSHPDAGSAADAGAVDAGDQGGGPSGDQDQDPNAVPSRCNTNEDCPLEFNCVSHKCRPFDQRSATGCGCGQTEGLAAGLGLLVLAGLRRRRPGRA